MQKSFPKLLSSLLILAVLTAACQTLAGTPFEGIIPQSSLSPTNSTVLTPPAQTPASHITTPASTSSQKPPNIIFILTDDLDTASIAYMPKLQEYLVKGGLAFSNYIVNVSLCCPSRATTLCGQYTHNTKVLTNSGDNGGYETFVRLGLENETVAVWLQNAGYRTALLGKYLNGYPNVADKNHIPPGWTEWYSPVIGKPYSEFNYTLNENGKLVDYGSQAKDYETDVLANKAADFIQRSATSGQPFFVYLAVYAPHSPATPAPHHANLFNNLKAPQTPSYNEADVSDKPEHIQALSPLTTRMENRINGMYVHRLQSLQAVDEAIEKLIKTLESSGQLENTYLIFTSDNGYHLGQHRMGEGKQSPYEEDIRVPLLVIGPDVLAGQTRSELVGNVDLAATFADIAGLQLPTNLDGRSLLPLFSNNPAPPDWRQAYLIQHIGKEDNSEAGSNQANHQAALSEMAGLLEPPDVDDFINLGVELPSFIGLRTLQYTYVEYDNGEQELYDLLADPAQLNNLAGSADMQLVSKLSAWLQQFSTCQAAQCRLADQKSP